MSQQNFKNNESNQSIKLSKIFTELNNLIQLPIQNIDQPQKYYLLDKNYPDENPSGKNQNYPFCQKMFFDFIFIQYPKDFIPIKQENFQNIYKDHEKFLYTLYIGDGAIFVQDNTINNENVFFILE